jgi:putative ATPase
MDLFVASDEAFLKDAPLAERLRPKHLDDVLGQDHLLGREGLLSRALARGRLPSLILWGPPGTGKTTLAEILSRSTGAHMERLSAVLAGVKDIRAAVEKARRVKGERGLNTVLFIDEIHRFNKAQQDALLPHVERGVVTLIGATTENPSFEVNSALLSRCRVVVTKSLDPDALGVLAARALADAEKGLGESGLVLHADANELLILASGGDARRLLTALEVAADLALADGSTTIEVAHAESAVSRRMVLYDKAGDEHYNVVSAFIKSMRGSDPDAACHYLARMLEAGEDPRFILRRLVIFASEDVGNADPMALNVATSALTAFELVGLPEGVLPLTQATTYLACAPKSNAVITAYGKARRDVIQHGAVEIPLKLRNAPTDLMKKMGYGNDYRYPHQYENHYVAEDYLPEALAGRRYYQPSEEGAEAAIKERLARLRAQAGLDSDAKTDDDDSFPHHR